MNVVTIHQIVVLLLAQKTYVIEIIFIALNISYQSMFISTENHSK